MKTFSPLKIFLSLQTPPINQIKRHSSQQRPSDGWLLSNQGEKEESSAGQSPCE
jgi:hypothetical protein